MVNYINFLLSKAGEKFIKNKSQEVFYCKDPNCPHCAYDENAPLVSDEEIEEEAEKHRAANPGTKGGGNNTKILNAFKAGAIYVRNEYEN